MPCEEATDVIKRSMFVEVNGGELEPIWDIYKPEGVALVIRQALVDAGLWMTAADRAVLAAADDTGVDAQLTWANHYENICGCYRCKGLAVALRARRNAAQWPAPDPYMRTCWFRSDGILMDGRT